MEKKKLAKSAGEFDRRFDAGEDIHGLIDMSKAKVVRHGKKVWATIRSNNTHAKRSKASKKAHITIKNNSTRNAAELLAFYVNYQC
ncbi:MAG: hypothetical protein DDT19_00554 [Syntrophomonadaceae bacterium]|nr:hypothetical protein [Bacillota bacterium]